MYSNSNTLDISENLRKWCQSSLTGASLSTVTLIVTFKKICCYYGNKQNRCSVLTVSPKNVKSFCRKLNFMKLDQGLACGPSSSYYLGVYVTSNYLDRTQEITWLRDMKLKINGLGDRIQEITL